MGYIVKSLILGIWAVTANAKKISGCAVQIKRSLLPLQSSVSPMNVNECNEQNANESIRQRCTKKRHTIEQKAVGLLMRGGAMSSTIEQPRGGATTVDHSISKRKTTTLNALHLSSFLIVASISIVAFSPLPSLTRHLNNLVKTGTTMSSTQSPQSRAMQILSILSSISASIELFASPLVGVWIDSLGRKVPTIILYSLVALSNTLMVLHPSVGSICISKVVNGVVGGFLVIITNAIIADMFASSSSEKGVHSKDEMGAVFGRQAAVVSTGFLLGSLIGGKLTEGGERLAYGFSLLFSVLAVLNGSFRMMESLVQSKGVKDDAKTHPHSWDHETVKQKLLEAPLSSVQLLFYYGSKMRTLALLLMLQSAPMFMGDVFQLFAKEYWNLSPSAFGSLIALFGVLGIFSNLSLPLLLGKLGIRNFTLLAIASSFLFPVTTLVTKSYKPVLIAGCVGLFSGCQKIGTSTAMTSLASDMGIKQGQLQGEKASMLALLRIMCPVVYGMLYLRGKEWCLTSGDDSFEGALSLTKGWIGTKLPFVMNIFLGIFAFFVTWKNI